MKSMHRLLERQIRKYLENEKIPGGFTRLFAAISDTYTHFDEDRRLIERSLELSSKEMNEKNELLNAEIAKAKQSTDEFRRLNKFMINRELKMVELKELIEKLKDENAALKK